MYPVDIVGILKLLLDPWLLSRVVVAFFNSAHMVPEYFHAVGYRESA